MATHRNQDADASSCVLATLSPCQHVGEIMAAAAGCGLPAGVRTIPEHPGGYASDYGFGERVCGSDTTGHDVSCYVRRRREPLSRAKLYS